MRRIGLVLAAALTIGLLAPGSEAAPAGKALSDGHVRRAPVSPVVAKALGPAGELRGMAINDGLAGRPLAAAIADFPRMAADGITSVSLYAYLYLPSPSGTTLKTGPLTPTDDEIEAVTTAARANGLGVHLMPVLLAEGPYMWRGYFVPSNVDAFFASYTVQVARYAQLAQRLGVTLFYVGSENDLIANRTAHWKNVVREVRKHYKGAVTYMSTGHTPLVVRFWDVLDLASISVYFSMGEDANPSYDRFRAAWREVHTPYLRMITGKIRKPLIFSEAGYNSAQHAFAHPERNPTTGALPAPAAQADGYRAMLEVIKASPNLYGVAWWRWGTGGSSADTSYSPNGKPAECVLAAHWSKNPAVLAAATAGPTCDLHAFDAALATVSGVVPK